MDVTKPTVQSLDFQQHLFQFRKMSPKFKVELIQ